MAKSRTQPGDVLMNIVGPPLGKVAIVPANHPSWNINQAITLFRPSERISTGWLYCILCSGVNISDIVHETRGSAGQINISLSQCRDFVFPVPPASEQAEIIRRVEALFALADRIEARATAARTHAQRLSALTLAKAFRGELVPQDPENEPASKLLKRVASATAIISKKKLKVSRPKATSMKYTPTSTREELLKLPLGVYSFDHLRSLIPAEYETLKNAIFLLLNEPSSGLKQVFDKAQNSLVFERYSK